MKRSFLGALGALCAVTVAAGCTGAAITKGNFVAAKKNTVWPLVKMSNAPRTIASSYGPYDGPAVDINFVNTKPAKYSYCDRYQDDKTTRRYRACEFGRDEAERMAERFGGGNGRIYGFLRGYAWGLQKGAKMGQGDQNAINEGRKAVDGMGQFMQAGLEAGKKTGMQQGDSNGRSDAIARFKAVMNTGKNPDDTLRIPSVSYPGEDNAYAKYVGKVPTTQEIVQKEVTVEDMPVYHDYDATYLGEVTAPTLWDLWSCNGAYSFEKAYWYDGVRAFETWLQRPIDTKADYQNLDLVPLPTTDMKFGPYTCKEVFEDSFKQSYGYYVNYHFSSKFYENLDMGQFNGEKVGTQVGARIAHYIGLEAAFNEKFKASSVSTFQDAYKSSYTDTFKKTFGYYLSNPVLNVKFDQVIGELNDGIIQPGEKIGAQFSVWNMGGVPADLSTRISGDIVDPTVQSFRINKLSSSGYKTGMIATIDPRLPARATAKLTIHVNNVSDTIGQDVHNVAEVSDLQVRLNVQDGSGAVHLSVHNPSTMETAGEIKATLTLMNRKITVQSAGKLFGGDTEDVVLDFSNLDPLALIKGDISGKVVVTMFDRVIDEKAVHLQASDRNLEMARYFTLLSSGAGFVPKAVDREARWSDVFQLIADTNEREVLGATSNIWTDDRYNTMVGKLAKIYVSTNLRDDAKARFNDLAIRLYQERGHLGKTLGIKSGKRKAYESLCEEIWDKKVGGGKDLSQHQKGQHQGQGQR